MFKWYKNFMKQYFENKLKNMIEFNEYAINKYKSYPKEVKMISKFKEELAISMGYTENVWKGIKKYGIDKDLWDRHLDSCEEALIEFRKMEDRIKKEKLKEEERMLINACKNAILELKKENLI